MKRDEAMKRARAIVLAGGDYESAIADALQQAAKEARYRALREAIMAVHALRPAEHETSDNQWKNMIVHPHLLKQWVKDREAVDKLLPDDWRNQLLEGK